MKPTYYRIHAESLLRTDELGDEFELPYSEELQKAVLLINKLCSEEVKKRQRYMDDEYLAKQFHRINGAIAKLQIKDILYEILEYVRKVK